MMANLKGYCQCRFNLFIFPGHRLRLFRRLSFTQTVELKKRRPKYFFTAQISPVF